MFTATGTLGGYLEGLPIDMSMCIGSIRDWKDFISKSEVWNINFENNNILTKVHRVNQHIFKGQFYIGIMITAFNKAPGNYLRQSCFLRFKKEEIPAHLIYPYCGFLYIFDFDNPFQIKGYY